MSEEEATKIACPGKYCEDGKVERWRDIFVGGGGSGHSTEHWHEDCEVCGGSGEVVALMKCGDCQGEGEVEGELCKPCDGDGAVPRGQR